MMDLLHTAHGVWSSLKRVSFAFLSTLRPNMICSWLARRFQSSFFDHVRDYCLYSLLPFTIAYVNGFSVFYSTISVMMPLRAISTEALMLSSISFWSWQPVIYSLVGLLIGSHAENNHAISDCWLTRLYAHEHGCSWHINALWSSSAFVVLLEKGTRFMATTSDITSRSSYLAHRAAH